MAVLREKSPAHNMESASKAFLLWLLQTPER